MTPPPGLDEPLTPAQRRAVALGLLGAHLAAGWALLQAGPMRRAVGEPTPVFVDWVAAPAPVPSPPRPRPEVASPPKPRPTPLTLPPEQTPSPASFIAEPPLPEPAPPVERPQAPSVAPADLPTAPAPAPVPKTIPVTAVEYLAPPQLAYPAAARRAREQGTVHVRVRVDASGLPQQIALARSSGHARLDEAALATVHATRFKPYTENGVALPFWVVMPMIFELDH